MSILAMRLGTEVTHSCVGLISLEKVFVYRIRSKFLCFGTFKLKVYFYKQFVYKNYRCNILTSNRDD